MRLTVLFIQWIIIGMVKLFVFNLQKPKINIRRKSISTLILGAWCSYNWIKPLQKEERELMSWMSERQTETTHFNKLNITEILNVASCNFYTEMMWELNWSEMMKRMVSIEFLSLYEIYKNSYIRYIASNKAYLKNNTYSIFLSI